MLAILAFIPLLVVAGVAIFAAIAAAGCSGSEEKKQDSGSAPDVRPDVRPDASAPRKCQGTTLPADVKLEGIVDPKSVDTFNLVWPGSIKPSNIENWSPRGRLYFGAAEELLRPTCTFADQYSSGIVAAHRQGIATFLGGHYAKAYDSNEEAILALTAGLSDPAGHNTVIPSWRILGEQTPKHRDFANLMTAAFWLNEAFKNASNRFTAPVASAQTDRKAAQAAIQQWDTLLQGVDSTKLDDREFEYYRVLTAAADRFKKSLGYVPPPWDGGTQRKDGGTPPPKDAGGTPPVDAGKKRCISVPGSTKTEC